MGALLHRVVCPRCGASAAITPSARAQCSCGIVEPPGDIHYLKGARPPVAMKAQPTTAPPRRNP